MEKSVSLHDLPRERFDLVIVGSGLAGLSTAFYASKCKEKSIAVITKSRELDCSSYYAQGGIAVALGKGDSAELHAKDTIAVGEGLCNETAVKALVKEGKQRVQELIDLGLEFDENESGLEFGREAAHSLNRVLHIKGDETGKHLTLFVLKLAREQGNVSVIAKNYATELVAGNGGAKGLIVKCPEGEKLYEARAFVLATGGYSALYSNSTNPGNSVGEGTGIAFRAGAKLMDLEFVQFHPTTLPVKGKENFLISEAVRGEDAKIVNSKGERFLEKFDARAELAPRDLVSRAVFQELEKGEKVFLDASGLGIDLRKRFPSIHRKLKEMGYSMEKNLVPVEPAAHYTVGGIAVDLDGASSIKGLYANGEGSCNKVHGANRLASNSLLDAIVFGARSAEKAVKEKRKTPGNARVKREFNEIKADGFLGKVKAVMWEHGGILREKKMIKAGLEELNQLKKGLPLNESIESIQAGNALLLAGLCLKQMLAREESRGCHYRNDFPEKSPNWAKHAII